MAERAQVSIKKPEAKRENKASQTQKTGPSQSISSPVEQILLLQRTIGNQAVGRLIKSGALQPKLKIGQPGDKYEQEADRVAEQVMRMSQASEETKISNPAHPIQRKCPGCNKGTKTRKEEEEEKLQKEEAYGSTPEVTPELESRISAVRRGGQPLPESARAFFEPRFGRDFSQVRVHTDAQAAEAAREVNARAFTLGRDLVFGEGEYAPGTREGQKLLAHELMHMVQQGISKTIHFKPDDKKTQPKASLTDFKISSNAANIVDIGTHVTYTVEQIGQTVTPGTSYRFSWYLYNDKKSYEDLIIISKICSACNVKVPRVPMEIKGPINSKTWELIAVYPGVHRIVATISLNGASITELEFKQQVSGTNWKDVETLILKKIDDHTKLYPELTTFQNQLNKIVKDIFTKYSNPSDLPPKEKAGLWALGQLDVKEWTKSATSPGRGTEEIGEGYKCNKFVADAFGFGAGLGYGTPKGYPTNEHTRLWGIYKAIYPPVANDLADPNKNINNFPVIAYKDHTAKPPQNIPANKLEFGDVIAFYAPGGIGHSGIYLGNGLYIAAGGTRGGYIEPISNQEPPLLNHKYTTYRRYTPP